MAYDVKPIDAPRAAGFQLRLLTNLVENPLSGSLLARVLLGNAGVLALRAAGSDDPPPAEPLVFTRAAAAAADAPEPGDGAAGAALLAATELAPAARPALPSPAAEPPRVPAASTAADFGFCAAADFVAAYRSGRTTPLEVAQRVIEETGASERHTPPLRVFIAQDAADLLRQAEAATARYRAGSPLGPLDGVPLAVKDELDQLPYPTTVGTRFLGERPAAEDAEAVARLRRAGALLIGKANMHEIGLGVTGLNPHHGACRNPYDPRRASGGSSSGPAAAVALGLCPVALGADGGGSIRIPAAFCGVVGLKPTFGRVSEHGAAPLCWSVAHVGPLGATVRDVALAYAQIAGPDPRDANSLRQPQLRLDGLERGDLSGLVLGVYTPWFEHAEPAIVEACRAMLRRFAEAGARLQEIELPELGLLRTVHLVTIVSEMAASQMGYQARARRAYGLDTRLNLALGRRLQSADYVHAQRHRNRLNGHFARALAEVNAIATPATACTAPLLPAEALRSGESNLPLLDRIMRFAPAANLTGLPAVSFPAGYDGDGLPIGMQLIGRAWEEHLLLRLARAAESYLPRRRPQVHARLLPS